MMTVRERLHAYMKQHRLTRQKMADALSTPVKTMRRRSGRLTRWQLQCRRQIYEGRLHLRRHTQHEPAVLNKRKQQFSGILR